MKAGRESSLREAKFAMRASGGWWDAFDRCVHRVRFWNVRYALRKCIYDRELARANRGLVPRGQLLRSLKKVMDKAHDMKLSEENNLECCVEQARGSEVRARIFYEEYEEREWQTLPNPQRKPW